MLSGGGGAYPPGASPWGGRFAGGAGGTGHVGAGGYDEFPQIVGAQAVWTGTRLRATVGPPPSGRRWLVTRATVSCSTYAKAYLYVGSVQPENLVAGTPAGAMDDYEATRPIPVREHESVTVEWVASALTADSEGYLRVEYLEV